MVATLSASAKNANITVSGGGLVATGTGAGGTHYAGLGDATTTIIESTDARYWEVTVTDNVSGGGWGIGVGVASTPLGNGQYLGSSPQSFSWYPDGTVYSSGSSAGTVGTYVEGDTLGVACIGGDQVWFSVNGVFTGNPAGGTGGIDISALGDVFPGYNVNSGDIATFNFGATALDDAPPTGFTAFDSAVGTDIVVVSGTTEILGTFPAVAGTFEPVTIVAGVAEMVGAQMLVAGVGAEAAIDVISGEVTIAGATPSLSASIIVVVPGTVRAVGATLSVAEPEPLPESMMWTPVPAPSQTWAAVGALRFIIAESGQFLITEDGLFLVTEDSNSSTIWTKSTTPSTTWTT